MTVRDRHRGGEDRRMITSGLGEQAATTQSSWAHFLHDADIGVVGIGPTKAEAFRQAALALTAVITNPGSVRPEQPVPVFCQAGSDDLLFVEWLNALVYEMAVRMMKLVPLVCVKG